MIMKVVVTKEPNPDPSLKGREQRAIRAALPGADQARAASVAGADAAGRVGTGRASRPRTRAHEIIGGCPYGSHPHLPSPRGK